MSSEMDAEFDLLEPEEYARRVAAGEIARLTEEELQQNLIEFNENLAIWIWIVRRPRQRRPQPPRPRQPAPLFTLRPKRRHRPMRR